MIDRDTLRTLIREVVAAEVKAAGAGPAVRAPDAPRPAEPPVRIASDADLAAFARRVLALAADPATRAAIESGRYPFRLAAGGAGSGAAGGSGAARILEGVVSEKTLAGLPRGTSVLQVGPEVAVTPLARDRARRLKITIERIRP